MRLRFRWQAKVIYLSQIFFIFCILLRKENDMSKDIISYTLTHDELETMLSSEYGTKVEPVDLKQLNKQKMNQQRARMMEKNGYKR